LLVSSIMTCAIFDITSTRLHLRRHKRISHKGGAGSHLPAAERER
jgi:hypothetical protein